MNNSGFFVMKNARFVPLRIACTARFSAWGFLDPGLNLIRSETVV